MTDFINSLYRAYDTTATTTEQLWRYLLPFRTLTACLYTDLLLLVVTWLSDNIEVSELDYRAQPIYLAALSQKPWCIGYVTPIIADTQFIMWYTLQWCDYTLGDIQAMTVSCYYEMKSRLLALIEVIK